MRRPPKPGFWLVARREWRWLLHDRVALILIFGVPLFAFVVLGLAFSHPVIRGLGVVVVDEDRSETSRAFVEQVAASPNLSIVERTGDLASAARAIRAGEAIAAVYIPANFERDLKAERRPQVVAFYNQQFLTAAGVASSGLSDSSRRRRQQRGAASRAAPKAARIGSLVPETIALVNPRTQLRAIPAARAAADGDPRRHRARRRLFGRLRVPAAQHARVARCAGGNPIVALAGKLAPLFVIFFFIMLSVPLILEGMFGIAFKGDVPMIVAAGIADGHWLSGARSAAATADARLPTGLGLTGLIVSPAFGFVGVGFPIIAMNAFSAAGARSCRCAGTWRCCSGRRRAGCRCRIPRARSRRWRGWPCSSRCWRSLRLRSIAAAWAAQRPAGTGAARRRAARHRRGVRGRMAARARACAAPSPS